MTVYIGKTTLSLKRRLQCHKAACKIKSNIQVYQWLDDTCSIELIEDCINSIRELEVIQEYTTNGFTVMNTNLGEKILDPKSYNKAKNTKKHSDYHNWHSGICQKAKREGLTSKEYREKYNIPDYTGPKTI